MSLKWIIILFIIVFILLQYVFKINYNWLYYLLLNIVLGVCLIWIVNLSGVLYIPFCFKSKLITGIFGIPGVMCLSLMALAGWL